MWKLWLPGRVLLVRCPICAEEHESTGTMDGLNVYECPLLGKTGQLAGPLFISKEPPND